MADCLGRVFLKYNKLNYLKLFIKKLYSINLKYTNFL